MWKNRMGSKKIMTAMNHLLNLTAPRISGVTCMWGKVPSLEDASGSEGSCDPGYS